MTFALVVADPVVTAFCGTVFCSERFNASDVLAALIVAHHVGATLCAGGHHAQVRGVVILRVHGCLVAYDSISDRVEGFLGRHREFPTARAEERPAGLISARASLVEKRLPAAPVLGEASVCSDFSIWSPKSFAVLLARRAPAVVAVSLAVVAGEAVLGVGVCRAGGGETSAVLRQVAVACLRPTDAACRF